MNGFYTLSYLLLIMTTLLYGRVQDLSSKRNGSYLHHRFIGLNELITDNKNCNENKTH